MAAQLRQGARELNIQYLDYINNYDEFGNFIGVQGRPNPGRFNDALPYNTSQGPERISSRIQSTLENRLNPLTYPSENSPDSLSSTNISPSFKEDQNQLGRRSRRSRLRNNQQGSRHRYKPRLQNTDQNQMGPL